MNTARILLGVALVAGTVALPATAAFAATPNPGPAYGQHVSLCARTMGFSGALNPGMHQGKTGWGSMPCATP